MGPIQVIRMKLLFSVLSLVLMSGACLAQGTAGPPAVSVTVPLTAIASFNTHVVQNCQRLGPLGLRICTPQPFVQAVADTAPDGKLAQLVLSAVKIKYAKSGSTSGLYLGKAVQAKVGGDLDGIRVRVITPSEVFRDGSDDWDEYEVAAAVQSISADQTTGSVTVWIIAQNYFYRSRRGLNFGLAAPAGPSPDWTFDALNDFDAVNGRLQAIRDGIKSAVPSVPGSVGNPIDAIEQRRAPIPADIVPRLRLPFL